MRPKLVLEITFALSSLFFRDYRELAGLSRVSISLTPSVLGRVFIFILLIIWRFYTASETHVGIEMVQTRAINLLTSIYPS